MKMNPLSRRRGTTLLEVIVALGIFVTVLVGIMQGLIATRNYVGEDEIRNDLELEGLRLLKEFTGDLGNSAWFHVEPLPVGTITLPVLVNKPVPMLVSPEILPNVGKGAAGAGTTDWGDQLDFVKLRLKDLTALSPYELRVHTARINLQSSVATSLDQFLTAKSANNLIVNEEWSPGIDEDLEPYVWPVFESGKAALTFDQNRCLASPANSPRLYRYIVRAIPGTTNGRMVRQYSNGPGLSYAAIPTHAVLLTHSGATITPPAITNTPNPWIDDVILSDNIKATNDPRFPTLVGTPGLRFDTNLTDPSLSPNQVRITVMLVRTPVNSNDGTVVRRVIQTSVAMRSITYN